MGEDEVDKLDAVIKLIEDTDEDDAEMDEDGRDDHDTDNDVVFEVDPVDDDLEVDPVEAALSLVEKEAACRFMEKGSRDAFERGKLMRCARTWEKARSKWGPISDFMREKIRTCNRRSELCAHMQVIPNAMHVTHVCTT